MPKRTDSFFIRRSVNFDNKTGTALTFQDSEIDLGAYVDALGMHVLRIHNIAVQFTDGSGTSLQVASGKGAAAQFQLTTQKQTDTIKANDKSVIASGVVYAQNPLAAEEFPQVYESMDVLPQLWTNGYLVAVESIYLGGEASTHWEEDVYCTIVMECTSERMSKEAGLALALSQQ